jgi:hypothetical protein
MLSSLLGIAASSCGCWVLPLPGLGRKGALLIQEHFPEHQSFNQIFDTLPRKTTGIIHALNRLFRAIGTERTLKPADSSVLLSCINFSQRVVCYKLQGC